MSLLSRYFQPIRNSDGVDWTPARAVGFFHLSDLAAQVYGPGVTLRTTPVDGDLLVTLWRTDVSSPYGELVPLDPVDGEPRQIWIDDCGTWRDIDGRELHGRIAQYASVPATIVWEAVR